MMDIHFRLGLRRVGRRVWQRICEPWQHAKEIYEGISGEILGKCCTFGNLRINGFQHCLFLFPELFALCGFRNFGLYALRLWSFKQLYGREVFGEILKSLQEHPYTPRFET
jgi:hypothetical protein